MSGKERVILPEPDPKVFETYVAAWKKRQEARERQLEQLTSKAKAAALKLANILIYTYGADEVWLFGSLVRAQIRPRGFDEYSDIDLAVRGLPQERYFHILSQINAEVDFSVDLIDMNACPPWLSEVITREGKLLATRKKEGTE